MAATGKRALKDPYKAAYKLERMSRISDRIKEIQAEAQIDPDDPRSMLGLTIRLLESCMGDEPVLDRNGKPMGEYKKNYAVAWNIIKGLEPRTRFLQFVDPNEVDLKNFSQDKLLELAKKVVASHGLKVVEDDALELVEATGS